MSVPVSRFLRTAAEAGQPAPAHASEEHLQRELDDARAAGAGVCADVGVLVDALRIEAEAGIQTGELGVVPGVVQLRAKVDEPLLGAEGDALGNGEVPVVDARAIEVLQAAAAAIITKATALVDAAAQSPTAFQNLDSGRRASELDQAVLQLRQEVLQARDTRPKIGALSGKPLAPDKALLLAGLGCDLIQAATSAVAGWLETQDRVFLVVARDAKELLD